MIKKGMCAALITVVCSQATMLGHCDCWLAPLTGGLGLGLIAGSAIASPRHHETIIIEKEQPTYSRKDIKRLRTQIDNLSNMIDDLRDEVAELTTKLQKKRKTIELLTAENEKLTDEIAQQKAYIKKLERALGKEVA